MKLVTMTTKKEITTPALGTDLTNTRSNLMNNEIVLCQGCGAQIIWIKTKSGKSMPVNATVRKYWQKDKAAGKVVTADGEVLSCEFEGVPGTETGVGYISHFATCPKAGKFRKK